VTFSGKHLFVNLDAPDGELAVEVARRREGRLVVAAVKGNATRLAVALDSRSSRETGPLPIPSEEREAILVLGHGDAKGASGGYVAAGGPGSRARRPKSSRGDVSCRWNG
jgi:hypothetical protein